MAKHHSRSRSLTDLEPTLSDLIDDPVLRAVMARDGLDCSDVVAAIDVGRARLGLGPWTDAPCGPHQNPACCG
jgi:hypothetical protein